MRYHGGKWRLAPWIMAHFPPHAMYVEPFGCGAAVLLRKPPSRQEIYNDLDGEVVNVFRVLRDPAQAERLARLLALTPVRHLLGNTSGRKAGTHWMVFMKSSDVGGENDNR
jgi:DNA adenine methylase